VTRNCWSIGSAIGNRLTGWPLPIDLALAPGAPLLSVPRTKPLPELAPALFQVTKPRLLSTKAAATQLISSFLNFLS
jgi:hypothetical protein